MSGPAASGAGELAWLASNGQVRVHSGNDRIRTYAVDEGCHVMSFSGRHVLLGCPPAVRYRFAGRLLDTSTGAVTAIPHDDPREAISWERIGAKWIEGSYCEDHPHCGVRLHRRTGRRETYGLRPDPVTLDVGGPDFDLNTETGAPGPQWRLTHADDGWITAHRAGKRWEVTSRGGSAQINSAGIVGLVTKGFSSLPRVYVTDPRRRRVKRITGLRRRSGERFAAAFPLRGKVVVVVSRYSPATRSYSNRLIETDLPL